MIAGGKGVNVAATLAAGGVKTAVTGILGADNADFFNRFFAARGIDNHFIEQAGRHAAILNWFARAIRPILTCPAWPPARR